MSENVGASTSRNPMVCIGIALPLPALEKVGSQIQENEHDTDYLT
jgi:hypothetical protein